MNTVEKIQRWYGSTVRLDRRQRGLMYRALAAQLEAGVSPLGACETLARDVEISKEVMRVAHCAATAAREGRPLAVGLREAMSIPQADLGVLAVAERTQKLAAALSRLAEEGEAPLSLARNVIAPCAYFGVILIVLVVFGVHARDLLTGLSGSEKVTAVPAYQLSVVLNAVWIPAVVIVGGYLVVVLGYGRSQWVGGMRRLLWFFDGEARVHLVIRYADLAESLYLQGANHMEVLHAMEEAYGTGSRFVGAAIRDARQDVVEGMDMEKALAGRLVPRALAELVTGMVPLGERGLYPQAWRTVARIQRAVLERRYGVAVGTLRLVLLLGDAALLLTLGHGLYTTMMLVGPR